MTCVHTSVAGIEMLEGARNSCALVVISFNLEVNLMLARCVTTGNVVCACFQTTEPATQHACY